MEVPGWNRSIQQDILRVSEMTREYLRGSGSLAVEEILDHLFLSQGKFLRAGITMLAGQSANPDREKLLSAAAAFEMLHLATLVHDDIIDDSDLRRGKLSVQKKFGKDVAVYTGDYILARTFRLISGEHVQYLGRICQGMERICAGEILQNSKRFDTEINSKCCLKIMRGKTAELFALCAETGALLGGRSKKEAAVLSKAARYMGMAFQIQDDCRDYLAGREALRKDPESDLANGIFTLPLVFALRNGEIPEFKEKFQNGEISELAAAVRSSQGMKESLLLAKRYGEKSQILLQGMKQDQAVCQLQQLFQKMIGEEKWISV